MTARPISTYSIVAFDPATGQIGVAVQSHWFSVGTVVSWAQAGVGAVATQALAQPSYGPRGLELMSAGKSSASSLSALLAEDEERDVRQVAFVDGSGDVAVHTGRGCIAEAGHRTGDHFSVQANMMERATVWEAMADAYRSANGDLADRLVVALEAAEAEGGDIRGRQSAALLVVSAAPTGEPWVDRLYDLRIEDHSDPLGEIRRLVRLRRAYHHMSAGDDAIGSGDMSEALAEYEKAEALVPEILEMPFWKAVGLLGTGHIDEALPIFTSVFAREPAWKQLLPRIVDAGLLETDAATLATILE